MKKTVHLAPSTVWCRSRPWIKSGAGQGEAEPSAPRRRGGLRPWIARTRPSTAASHRAADDGPGADG
ncbi:hypothetical protein L665_04068 [Ralstonia solanacearum SD54]|nr:hypothetical protein L665_04068 [Ralstonia solanacearum SD54]